MLFFYFFIFSINAIKFSKITSKPLIKSKNINYINKNTITITPGGYKGFYTLGICHYLKENYDLNNYIYSGASAGAWNALFLSFKGNDQEFINSLFNIKLQKTNTIKNMQNDIKKSLLSKYDYNDFNLNKLFIGVTTFNKYYFNTVIYNDFTSLDDAIDCCIASSHIPCITGSFVFKYRNKLTFDGGFSTHPYLDMNNSTFLIYPELWNSNLVEETSEFNIRKKNTNVQNDNLYCLYLNGYKDSDINKDNINNILHNVNN
tara:strand:+ start:2593 stop:3372 length:780 start_codon:yes stop_codon:yes gene_type:complete